MRITRDEMLMMMAHVSAGRGTCLRLRVGAVIAIESRVVSQGYNGSPAGEPHCTPETCNPSTPCTRTIHAEVNAINWAKAYGIIDLSKATLYVTDSPCINCAQEIYAAGIRNVVYDREYRIRTGIEWLLEKGVQVSQCSISLATVASCVTLRTTPASRG